jgi:hypothetical protein
MWSQEEIELMLELEVQLEGQQQVAKKMEPYLPGKTNKQIRDNRTLPTVDYSANNRKTTLEINPR